MKSISKHIEFEVRVNSLSIGSLFGVGKVEDTTEDGYREATEDDIDLLAQFLGGGL